MPLHVLGDAPVRQLMVIKTLNLHVSEVSIWDAAETEFGDTLPEIIVELLRARLEGCEQVPKLRLSSLGEAAKRLNISENRARRLFRSEPGVLRILAPSDKRPLIQIPEDVFQRVFRRMAVPEPARSPRISRL
jgi:hypothetical protein